MQRNYPRMFSSADDQDKDGFKLENVAVKIGCATDFDSTFRLRITINISFKLAI